MRLTDSPEPIHAPLEPGRTPPAPARDALQPPLARLNSRDLLRDRPEVEILHGDQVYRLRLTALGKLILTK